MATDERDAWAAKLRLLVSPAGAVNSDGSVKQEFFKPQKVVFVADKKWGDSERDRLYEGLQQLGVGAWKDIRASLLPDWDETALRVKASRLLGSQSLARYASWKGDRAAVDAERERNRVIGERTGTWKSGVLVEDDAGSVAKALAEREEGAGEEQAAAPAAAKKARKKA